MIPLYTHFLSPLPPFATVRCSAFLASGRTSLGYLPKTTPGPILSARHQKRALAQPPGGAPFTSLLRLPDRCLQTQRDKKKHILLKPLQVSYPLHIARNTCIQRVFVLPGEPGRRWMKRLRCMLRCVLDEGAIALPHHAGRAEDSGLACCWDRVSRTRSRHWYVFEESVYHLVPVVRTTCETNSRGTRNMTPRPCPPCPPRSVSV